MELTERSGRIRQARKLTRRAGREKAGLFLAEGAQAVREAVATGADRIRDVIVTADARDHHADIVDDAVRSGIEVHVADTAALASLSETVTPQEIVAVCRRVVVPLDDLPAGALIAVLADSRDPGNVGTVIRCADAAGADAVVLTHGSADPEGGKAVRASAGSLFHLPVVTGSPLDAVIDRLRGLGMTVLAADGSGERDLDDAAAAGMLARNAAWVFGNEAWGLPDDARSRADHVVRVPIYGRAESLNLATAAAVCLYASARAQRRAR
ncbi:RNA methyltransferase [Actinobacteria bacterium YIM 96077]|uniref:RNA methyltransferase n=1 Tax=Phytoactinopolyspora halophila TaxID=1981511 RepID=A0A329QFU0_9ACTN|nr:RNA methyltransferase [Phytoactinopolyspora halophila]AYY13640.1 RNA methyltransferase [Actinobacteria bacterium YIM 96077]RAW11204.1 RNA methyltransferase [Phytoactinopolyspora halophila]